MFLFSITIALTSSGRKALKLFRKEREKEVIHVEDSMEISPSSTKRGLISLEKLDIPFADDLIKIVSPLQQVLRVIQSISLTLIF